MNSDEDEMIAKPSAAPGARPIPDDQGDLEVCTRFAVSKAIVDGFMRKMFVRGREVDIDQDQVTMVLLNEHKDGAGKWPDEFHHKVYQFKDSEARYWKTNLFVHKMTDVVEFVNDVMNKIQLYTYVLVYPLNPSHPTGPKHSVYADNLDPRTRNIECINSDPSDPYPDIPISRRGNVLYRVSCTASEMSLGPLTSPGHRALTTGTVRMREKPPRKPSDNNQNKRYSSPCIRYNQGIQGKMCPMSLSRTSLNSSGIGSRRESRRVSESSDGGVTRRFSGLLSAGSESNRNSRRVSESSEGGGPRRLSGLLSSPHHGSIPRAKSAMSLNTIQDQEIKGRLSQTTEEEQYYEADYHHSPLSSSSADNRDQYPQHFTFDVSREQTNIPRNSSEPVLQHYFLPVQTNLGHLETDSDNKKKKKPKKFGSIKSLFNLK